MIFAVCLVSLLIITFLRVCGVEGGISDWPPKAAGSQWKGRIPSNLLSYNAKREFLPSFHLPPLSKRAEDSKFHCSSLRRWSRQSPPWTFSAFSTSASQKGKFIYCYIGDFSSPSGTSLLKRGGEESRGEWNNNSFPNIPQNPVFYYSPLQNCILLAGLLNETLGLLTAKDLWRVKRSSEKPETRKNAAKGALSRSWRM